MKKNTKIYCLGSINVDLTITTDRIPNKGETLAGTNFIINSGGKGANQASAAAKLGADVKMIGVVGNDQFKDLTLNTLKKANVDVSNIVVDEHYTSGVAIIIKNDNDNRIILDGGVNMKISKEVIDKGLETSESGDIFITQFEINQEATLYGLKQAKDKGMVTILNPAPAREIPLEMYQLVDYLVINQSEAELLTSIYPSTKEEAVRIGEIIKPKGPQNVIVTMGEKGAVLINGNIHFIKSHKIKVVDTIGAGDAFIGSFAYGLTRGLKHEDILKLSNATSALVCLKEGAQEAMPSLEMVNAFLEKEYSNE